LNPAVSIVIPLLNEAESLPELAEWIQRVCRNNDLSYEIIFVDDGSRDESWQVISELKKQDEHIRAVRFQRNYGKSAALQTGFERARGEVIITMDADLQDSPDEIPALRSMVMENGYDLVSGWKQKRHDPLSKTLPTKLFNGVTRAMSGIKLHDFNCGLKAYRAEVVKSIEVYGEMHRYIPVIAKREGFGRIGEKAVKHQARKYGHTKFGFERFVNGFLDLLTITFISRFGKKPMHLFGTLGTLMFLIGFVLFAWIGGSKLWSVWMGSPGRNIAELSHFYVALTVMIIGTQLFLAGFIGELVSRNNPLRNHYKVREEI
jgi:glycosyltransferase involved in cell wall biosynthesis